jgi:hypothetical protein
LINFISVTVSPTHIAPVVAVIDKNTLEEEARVVLLTKSSTIHYKLISDCDNIYLITYTPTTTTATTNPPLTKFARYHLFSTLHLS